ncbi:MAG: hypothetical protein VYE47_12850 [Pseudomonadota bacterium]|nr:hypothetical protein [Pseudomonadota bacterium]
MDWDILLKAIAILVTLSLGIAKLQPQHPEKRLKEALKDDLEILSKLKPEDYGYDIVKRRVDIGIRDTYTVVHKRWYHVYHWDDLAIGLSFAGIFTYWTLIHIENSNLWGLLTGFLAVVGYAIIPDAFKEEVSKD